MESPDRAILAGTGVDVACTYITGSAGCGKTYLMRQRIADDPDYAQLCATTGVAAMNLGTVTLNSLLGFFDTDSMTEAFVHGWLERKVNDIAESGYRNLGIDEVSMLAAEKGDMLHQTFRNVNERRRDKGLHEMGLIFIGDFMQLPPIKERWLWEADCWPIFDANTIRLTKNWRQGDETFIAALSAIRAGRGAEGVDLLRQTKVTFADKYDHQFNGTTIIAKNKEVGNYNFAIHSRLQGQMTSSQSVRWGKLRSEWDRVPLMLQLKIGSYVVIKSNDCPAFTYCNGDCGFVQAFEDQIYYIKLCRNDAVVQVPKIVRLNTQREAPSGMADTKEARREHPYHWGAVGWDAPSRRWVTGGICYYPIELAYATTVHSSQGLSLDRIQIDVHNQFFGSPAMAYVALSRGRTPEGIRIVGTPELLASRVRVDPKVIRWL